MSNTVESILTMNISEFDQNMNTNVSQSVMEFNRRLAYFIVEFYTFPFIIVIGTISNSFTFLVMRRRMRRQSTYFYMGVLAIADEMVLLVGCLNFWLYVYSGKSFNFFSVFWCKVTCMALYATFHFSVWIVVIMTIERYIAVSMPLQANRLCTVKRAKIATSILALCVLAVNFHFLITHSLIGEECKSTTLLYSSFMNKIWPWIDGTIYSFIPLTLLIIFNILILNNLFKANKNSQDLRLNSNSTQGNERKKSSVIFESRDQNSKFSNFRSRAHSYIKTGNYKLSITNVNNSPQSSFNRKLTIMLITVSISFCVTSMPIVTLQSIEQAGLIQSSANYISVLRGVFLALQYLNHSINFFLYAITGKVFRREFMQLFVCRKDSKNKSDKLPRSHYQTIRKTSTIH